MTSYSFIKPKRKPILSLFSQIWLLFILFVILVFMATELILNLQNNSIKNATQTLKQNKEQISEKIAKIDEQIILLKTRNDAANEIFVANSILKQSMKNLFDLVPLSITLEEISMDKSSLVLKGMTPSKDTYNMLLAAPLKSIFNTSNTSFYQLPNGWLNFISTNKTQENDNE